jgi:hypothetical protein
MWKDLKKLASRESVIKPDSQPIVRHGKSFFPHFQRPQLPTHNYCTSTTGNTCKCGCVSTSAQSTSRGFQKFNGIPGVEIFISLGFAEPTTYVIQAHFHIW